MSLKVIFAGMDGAGKSTLACSVYLALRMSGLTDTDVGLHEIDVWSDTHGILLGTKHTREPRGNNQINYLADEFERAVERFVSDKRKIVLGDLHGRWQLPTKEYWQGLAADAAILVDRHPTPKDEQVVYRQSLPEWKDHLRKYNIPVALTVFSLQTDQPMPRGRSIPTDGLIAFNLNRCVQPMSWTVEKLAQRIKTAQQREKPSVL